MKRNDVRNRCDWVQRVLNAAMRTDKKYNRYDKLTFITRHYIEKWFWQQKGKCFYCKKNMQTKDRRLPDGCTIERLDNNFGHTYHNCVLACNYCNCILRRKNGGNKNFFYYNKKMN